MEQTQEPSQENGGEAFCEQVLAINRRVFENTGSQPLAFIRTYGCQQNASDSERLGGMLARMGYGFTENAQNADLVLFNTCAVREHAEQRVFGNVGALKPLKQLRPSVIIGLCGCMVQQEHIVQKLRKSYPYVDLVFGTHALQRLPELLYRVMTQEGRVYETPEADDGIAEGLPVRRSGGVKAWLPVMYGCNNFCSYCIVPYVRGREKSRRPEAVLAQATQLASEGCREITLLGQNVNSYGNDLSVGYDFARLLREINDIDGDFRIRFMTSHPKDATRALFSAMADCEKVAKHLHLPFQAGSDRVLRLMNRSYTTGQYLALVEQARSYMPRLGITSDVIVGFPTESYEEFQQTLDVVRRAEFDNLFTFIYSKRRGTPAEKLEDAVPHDEKARWLAELLSVQEAISHKRLSSCVGETLRVLCEGRGKSGGAAFTGRTDSNLIVGFSSPRDVTGQFVQVKITGVKSVMLTGAAEA